MIAKLDFFTVWLLKRKKFHHYLLGTMIDSLNGFIKMGMKTKPKLLDFKS